MNTMTFERSIVKHVRLHVMPTNRFKTFAISAYIGQPLTEDQVTPIALSPFVLRRGTQAYPETKQFRERLDDLFGAGFGFDIYKRGDQQIVQFRMDVINDQFVSGDHSLLKQALEFMGEALTNPALEEGKFRDKYVDAEKKTLQNKIDAIINDKIKYAAERCIAEMCKHEPYRLQPLGNTESLREITAQSLYDHYRQWISSAPIDLYVVGDTTLEEVEAFVEASFHLNRSATPTYGETLLHPPSEQVNTVIEHLDVNQGKLNMGLRTQITYADEQYPAALMYNGILGAYPHSKLFINVREKASLAYYAASRLDGHKGIMTIQSGIEIDNYEKAVDIIQQQLAAMTAGDISELEMSQTQAMISNQLREIEDSAFEMIAFDFNSVLSGQERTVPHLLEAIYEVNPTMVSLVANQVKLDTIYFLRDRKGE